MTETRPTHNPYTGFLDRLSGHVSALKWLQGGIFKEKSLKITRLKTLS